MVMTLKVEGVEETIAEFNAINIKVTKNVQEVIESSAIRVRDDARSRAPFKTGKLKRDIRVKKSKDGLTAAVTYMGKKRAFYGKFIEFGTRFMPARPFLGPAWEVERPNFIRAIVVAVDESHS